VFVVLTQEMKRCQAIILDIFLVFKLICSLLFSRFLSRFIFSFGIVDADRRNDVLTVS